MNQSTETLFIHLIADLLKYNLGIWPMRVDRVITTHFLPRSPLHVLTP
jgi:hypothetical protein